MPKRRVNWREAKARELVFATFVVARDQLVPGSVERIFLDHAMDHCIEAWLSESYGYLVRIVCWNEDGCEVERIG